MVVLLTNPSLAEIVALAAGAAADGDALAARVVPVGATSEVIIAKTANRPAPR